MPEAEDKEKAEKLAAAKKRFEQLKKQQKGKKAPSKKKDEKEDTGAAAANDKADEDKDAVTLEGKPEDKGPAESADAGAQDEDTVDQPSERPAHGRQPSLSLQSKLRSDSFRRSSGGQTPLSPTVSFGFSPSGLSGESLQDAFRKQGSRLEELERDNKRLQAEVEESEARWKKTEEELEEMREANVELVELKVKASLADTRAEEVTRLNNEIASLQRQNAHLQMASKPRRTSTSSPSSSDLAASLSSKSATIESLELDISNLNAQLAAAHKAAAYQADQISALENSLSRAERAASSATTELADLKQNLERASARAVKEGSERSSAATRIAQLEAEIAAAQRAAESAEARATALEKKIEALTTLHREAEARAAVKARETDRGTRETQELRTRVATLTDENARLREAAERRRKQGVDSDGAAAADGGEGVDELEDEALARAQARVRQLEEEVFELRRGIWRDRRRDLQPGLDGDDDTNGGRPGSASPGFDDVDLSAPGTSPRRAAQRSGGGGSSFQDVLSSGISALTGAGRSGPGRRASLAQNRPRKQSLGLLSEDEEDFAFDEDAFRAAQEEEARRRLERVKEVKRGLAAFKGWRVDLVEDRAGMGASSGLAVGPIFDV